jgi:hypothetical protein
VAAVSGFDHLDPELRPHGVAPLPAGWSEKNGGECRSCRAPIRWARNDETKRMSPFDLDGTSHFATCPDADTFRQKRDGPGSGAAAAVAVVEAARSVIAAANGELGIPTLDAIDRLIEAVDAFDRAVGVTR